MNYYKPSIEQGKLYIYNDRNEFVESKSLNDWEDFTLEDKVGIICYHLGLGQSAKTVATGIGMYLTYDEFLTAVECNKLYADMYRSAQKRRSNYLSEEMVSCNDEKRVKVLMSIITCLNKTIKESINFEAESNRPQIEMNTHLTEEKLNEVARKSEYTFAEPRPKA